MLRKLAIAAVSGAAALGTVMVGLTGTAAANPFLENPQLYHTIGIDQNHGLGASALPSLTSTLLLNPGWSAGSGVPVWVYCQTVGGKVTADNGVSSTIWDYAATAPDNGLPEGFVPDLFVDTPNVGIPSPGLPPCDPGPGSAGSPTQTTPAQPSSGAPTQGGSAPSTGSTPTVNHRHRKHHHHHRAQM